MREVFQRWQNLECWLPVCLDSMGRDYLSHLQIPDVLKVVVPSENFDEHGRNVDLGFDDGTTFPNEGGRDSASWSACYNQRSGWQNCYFTSGRFVISPTTVLYSCDDGGRMTSQQVAVAPREWCKDWFPVQSDFPPAPTSASGGGTSANCSPLFRFKNRATYKFIQAEAHFTNLRKGAGRGQYAVFLLMVFVAYLVLRNAWKQTSKLKSAALSHVAKLGGSGEYAFDIVGESKYQDALESICGGRTHEAADKYVEATLYQENSNVHDSQAVRVDIEGKTVGYLSRDDARAYRKQLDALGRGPLVAVCKAKIVGGVAKIKVGPRTLRREVGSASGLSHRSGSTCHLFRCCGRRIDRLAFSGKYLRHALASARRLLVLHRLCGTRVEATI